MILFLISVNQRFHLHLAHTCPGRKCRGVQVSASQFGNPNSRYLTNEAALFLRSVWLLK